MKPCSKRSFIITILMGKERNLKKVFLLICLQIRQIIVVPSFNIFWSKEFQKVHDLSYRVTEVLLHFLINTLYKNNFRNFLKGKNVYKLQLSWSIMQFLSDFFFMWYSFLWVFFMWVFFFQKSAYIWKTVLSIQTVYQCHQSRFFISSSHDYRYTYEK